MCNPLSPLGEGMILHLTKGFSQAKDAYGDKLGENRLSDSEEQDFLKIVNAFHYFTIHVFFKECNPSF